jgi:hypothetical protein
LDQARSTNFNQVTTLNEQFGFNMSAQDLQNYKNKKSTSQTEQRWEEIKLLLQSDPNRVKIYKKSINEVECIFIQTSFMRKMYKDHPISFSIKKKHKNIPKMTHFYQILT